MQFFALIMINVAMFAVFYLLISLKLERKATEFREKRMRRIMEEMINEFNETAERNISILENRISTLRRLLKISGEVSTLDVRLMDDESGERKKTSAGNPSKVFSDEVHQRVTSVSAPKPNAGDLLKVFIHDGADAISKTFKNILHRARSASASAAAMEGDKSSGYGYQHTAQRETDELIHKKRTESDLTTSAMKPKEEGLNAKSDNDEDLAALFSAAGDKYALVSDLYARGYSIESISRSSGIPQGEIRLVLNLGM